MQNSIWNYYGVKNCDGNILRSYQYEYSTQIEDIQEIVELDDTVHRKTMVLFISIKAASILARKIQSHVLIEQRFGLFCESLSEQQIKTFDNVIRLCAVKVYPGQFPMLLKTLFDWSSCSFAIMFDEQKSPGLITELFNVFENGLLTPAVIKACSNTVLSERASFIHIIRGNDGYSINVFSNQHI